MRTSQPSFTRLVSVALLLGALAGLGAGCSGQKQKTNKQDAGDRWNSARARVLLTLARDQYAAGNFDKCRKTLDDALALDPQNPQLHLLSAKLSIEQGQLELGERELMVVREKMPNDAEPNYLSGVIYQRWQKPDRAYEFYRTAAEKAPAEQAYLLAEVESLVALDRQPEALALLKSKVVYFENSAAIRDAYGQLLVQAKRYREAAEVLRQASVLAADDATIRERLALALYFDKQYREAGDVLAKVAAEEHNANRSDLLSALGQCQLETGKAREARATFGRVVELDPASAHGYLGLGRAALETGDLKRADLSLRKAQSLDADAAETHLMLGYLRLKQDRLKDALTAFQKASSLNRTDTTALCMIGYVYERTGRPDLAMQHYGRALKLQPGDELASKLMAGVNLND
jgi:Flp pilus assembly protein TadD